MDRRAFFRILALASLAQAEAASWLFAAEGRWARFRSARFARGEGGVFGVVADADDGARPGRCVGVRGVLGPAEARLIRTRDGVFAVVTGDGA